jgi:hypothetical protein
MFLIDDLLAAPLRGLAFVLKKILTVKQFSSVRSAKLGTPASPPLISEGPGHVSRPRSDEGAAAPSRPRSQEGPDHETT